MTFNFSPLRGATGPQRGTTFCELALKSIQIDRSDLKKSSVAGPAVQVVVHCKRQNKLYYWSQFNGHGQLLLLPKL